MGHIVVEGVGKAYRQYQTPWSRLAEWLDGRPRHQLHWVLRDLHFRIVAGEAVGVIGVNGAGKSTLLKMLSGTTAATTGRVELHGRVAALLELGLGFHPEFSGRQNVLMAGQLLGLAPAEIARLLPDIAAFADIGDYLDQPVRVYSSGMQVRLAFSVATCVRPDILIVDEALAVGDVFFQQKCFERIRAYTAAGTTLLFVSHSAEAILNICRRCLLLRQGALVFDGTPKEALDLYQADLLCATTAPMPVAPHPSLPPVELPAMDLPATQIIGRTGSIVTPAAQCRLVRFLDAAGEPLVSITADQPVRLQIVYRLMQALDDPHVGFKIRNRYGEVLFETNTYCMRQTMGAAPADTLLVSEFSFTANLFPAEYTVTVGLGNGGYDQGSFRQVVSYLHEVLLFTVLANPQAITWAGQVNLYPQVTCQHRREAVAHG